MRLLAIVFLFKTKNEKLLKLVHSPHFQSITDHRKKNIKQVLRNEQLTSQKV